MEIGSRSLLFGCHQIFIHPLFTLIGWVRLYGWSSINLQILLAIFFHDWGYWGCKFMDGYDGSIHPFRYPLFLLRLKLNTTIEEITWHSRHLSATFDQRPSRLCWADKLGLITMPSMLWALLAYASGEGWEYMNNPFGNDYVSGEDNTLVGLIRFHAKFRVAIRRLIP